MITDTYFFSSIMLPPENSLTNGWTYGNWPKKKKILPNNWHTQVSSQRITSKKEKKKTKQIKNPLVSDSLTYTKTVSFSLYNVLRSMWERLICYRLTFLCWQNLGTKTARETIALHIQIRVHTTQPKGKESTCLICPEDTDALKNSHRGLPGGPVAKTLRSQCSGPRFHPWSGN